MEKTLKGIVVLLTSCLISFSFSGGAAAADPQYVLRYAGNLPTNHHVSQSMYLFSKLVAEKTNGRVKIEVFPAAQLFADKDMGRAIPEGSIDIGTNALDWWTGIVPAALVSGLPLFYNDRAHHIRFEDSSGGDILKKEVETKGVKFINWLWTVEGDYFCTKKPILKGDDFKGLKIRGFGEMQSEALRALGATPVFMGGGEVYMALQRGTIDATSAGVSNLIERKQYEVTKYITYVPGFVFVTQWVLINKKKWDSLPADLQKTILEAGQEAQKWDREEEVKDKLKSLEFLKKRGQEPSDLPFAELEKIRNSARPAVLDYFLKRTGDQGKKLIEEAEKVR